MSNVQTPVYRLESNRLVAGVLAGAAQHFNINVLWLRLLFIASLFLPGPQLIIYLVAWVLMPPEPTPGTDIEKAGPYGH